VRARSALFTLFGDVVRPSGGEAWLTTLTAAMGALGFTPQATRTALHRMTTEGWVEPRRVGRYAAYRLTERGVDRLEEAAARIYRMRAASWDGRWRLLVTSPALDGGNGDRSVPRRNGPRDGGVPPEPARALRWMGFGRLTTEVWVSPHAHGDRLRALLAEHAMTPESLAFLSTTDGGDPRSPSAEDRRIVSQAWDLEALREAHAGFLKQWPADAPGAIPDPQAAFVRRMRLVHHWRSFLFLDPGLPLALLPDDWLGGEAAERFRDLYEASSGPAWAWWSALSAASPAAARLGTTPQSSPFARGLDALAARRQV
jgi:phenylacetic acid degradation operon negative regulatory protein